MPTVTQTTSTTHGPITAKTTPVAPVHTRSSPKPTHKPAAVVTESTQSTAYNQEFLKTEDKDDDDPNSKTQIIK